VNINWVLADDAVINPGVSLKALKNVGSFWGSWKTWRAYSTDNVICYDPVKAEELVKKSLQGACNFYLSKTVHEQLGKPAGIRLYDGDFLGHAVDNRDEIIAMHLSSSICDIVLLVGFAWVDREFNNEDDQARYDTYINLVYNAVKSCPDVQWILLDHPGQLHTKMTGLDNLTTDTLVNVMRLLTA
jgi:hypothetical protein